MLHSETVAACLDAMAAAIEPEQPVKPSEWGARHVIVPDGPRQGQPWDPSLTPQLIEPMDVLAVDSPDTRASLMKPGQAGATMAGMIWLGCMIDTAPARMMAVQPTVAAAREFNSEKLDPFIRGTPPLAAKVRPQSARSAYGSTNLRKKFPRGSLVLPGANSSVDLSSKTIRFALGDEVDRWPDDLDGQGHPMGMVDARQISFTRARLHKKFELSTPTIKGLSYIEAAYLAGDQRKWVMPCPHCADGITFEWKNFRCEPVAPYKPHYVCQLCGGVIEAWQQRGMVLAGHWVPQQPGPGRHKSYHYQGLTSLITDWETIAAKFRAAEGNPALEQTFYNLELGEPYEAESPDTDIDAIVTRCEDYPRGTVPARCARTVLVVDINGEWFEWALYGFGPALNGATTDQWLIETGKIDGKPDDEACWTKVAELCTKAWPHAGGGEFPADLVGIDTGFGTHEVYKFVRGRQQKVRALDGRPPLRLSDPRKALPLGTPVHVTAKNKLGQALFKVWLFPVFGHELKQWLANALNKYAAGEAVNGGIHLTKEIVDAAYADQLTAEVLIRDPEAPLKQRWVKRRGIRNEALDLNVYARALAFGASPNGLGVDRFTRDKWIEAIKERHGVDAEKENLIAPPPAPTAVSEAPAQEGETPAAPAPEAKPAPVPSPRQSFVGPNMKNWLKR